MRARRVRGPSVRPRDDAKTGDALASLRRHHVPREELEVLQEDPLSSGQLVAPRSAIGHRVGRRGHQAEVVRVIVGADVETPVRMIERVLVPFLSRDEQHGL